VVYAKQPLAGPAQGLEYLGRYTHRVAISNERIVAVDDREVRFRVPDSAAGNRKRLLRLPAATFIDRFLLHVLPQGFKRIRHYGLLWPAAKTVKLAQARRHWRCPHLIRWWWNRWRRSCAASSASDGRAARIVAKATSCRRRHRYRRGPLPRRGPP
jgi:hypothetical protein